MIQYYTQWVRIGRQWHQVATKTASPDEVGSLLGFAALFPGLRWRLRNASGVTLAEGMMN